MKSIAVLAIAALCVLLLGYGLIFFRGEQLDLSSPQIGLMQVWTELVGFAVATIALIIAYKELSLAVRSPDLDFGFWVEGDGVQSVAILSGPRTGYMMSLTLFLKNKGPIEARAIKIVLNIPREMTDLLGLEGHYLRPNSGGSWEKGYAPTYDFWTFRGGDDLVLLRGDWIIAGSMIVQVGPSKNHGKSFVLTYEANCARMTREVKGALVVEIGDSQPRQG